ncbi:MAG TPA: VWA domain-containing protein, partial [Gemmatimonadales bacterium]|nr:VWA domain-containing protein [Gemmatimonadales bacterium]
MSFAYPWVVPLGLVVLVLAAWLLRRAERARRAAMAAFGETEVLRRSSLLATPRETRRATVLRLVALGLGLLALARPQLGERESEMVRTGRDVLLVLDLSRSMGVGDVGGATRLAAAKEHAWDVVSAYPSDRVGLVVFGGSAFLQMPFTSDRASYRLFLDAASPDDLGDPATDVSAALLTAVSAFEHEGEEGRRAVLIVSDGESGEGNMEPAIAALRGAELPVFAIGVGTVRGGPVPADSSEAPERYHRDNIGRIVVSRLEEQELRAVAAATGGAYARWDRAEQRQALVTALGRVQPRTLAARETSERADRYQWPLGLMVVLLLVAEASSRAKRGILPARAGSLASLGMRYSFLLGLLSCSPAHRGERLYHQARYPEAYDVFRRALERDSSPRLAFDAGSALYRLERYDEAAAAFRRAARTGELRQRSLYNLGNALVRAAEERPGDPAPLLDAVAAYQEVLHLAPDDAEARWNLEVALRRLGDDRAGGGSSGRGRNADYGRGDNNVPGYEGNPDAAVGAMAGGGYGS